jgi:isopenicillin N synthase-like dioxygenase
MKSQSIPVIDIRELWNPGTLRALDHACREWGFFQVVNHGVDQHVIDTIQDAMHGFFALPKTEKQAISRSAENPWGFFDRELTKNVVDLKEIYDYGPSDGRLLRPQWPRTLPGFPGAVLDFYESCERLSFDLVAAISVNLGMAAPLLGRSFRPSHTSFLRLNYYPVCPAPADPLGTDESARGGFGISEHTDAGALTILLQDDQPGLEVLRRGAWHLVEPRADALVVNIGDIVQVWSNDRYKASLHRVIASSQRSRYSAPFFFNPGYETRYEPLPSTVDVAHPPRYRSISWGEFRALRAAGDYADLGEEIQISHYRATTEVHHGVH